MSTIESKPIAGRPRAGSPVLVLLAGGVAPSPLSRILGCSLLDLELAPGRTLLEWWCGHGLGGSAGPTPDVCTGPVRTVRGSGSPAVRATPSDAARISHLVDRTGPRGSAGALRDACEDDAPDTTIVAAEASSIVFAPIEPLLAAHATSGADVSLVATTTGRLAGLAFLQRSALDRVKARGYVDLKEQLLPIVRHDGGHVRVLTIDDRDVVRIHDRRGLLAASGRVLADGAHADGLFETAARSEVIDRAALPAMRSVAAQIDPDATISGSVVLAGSKVGRGAVVARSVVAPGAVVEPGQVVLDRIVGVDRTYRDEQLPAEDRIDTWSARSRERAREIARG